MIDPMTLLTVALMGAVTYLTRVGGYLLLSNRTLEPRTRMVLDTAPGCVLVSVIAPSVSGRPADLAAIAITALAAARLSLLQTVAIGVGGAALLRHLLA